MHAELPAPDEMPRARAASTGCRRRPALSRKPDAGCAPAFRRTSFATACGSKRPAVGDRCRRAKPLAHRPARRRRRRTGCPARGRAAWAARPIAPAAGPCVASRRMCFSRRPLQLHARRDARRELDDAMVEEGEAALDGMRHRHAVALRGEDVAGQQEARFPDTAPATADASARKSAGRLERKFVERVVAGKRRAADRRRRTAWRAAVRAEARQMREQRIVERIEAGREEGRQIGRPTAPAGSADRDRACGRACGRMREPGWRAQKRRSFASLKMS